MSDNDRTPPERFSLKRWSARKLDSARATPAQAPEPSIAPIAAEQAVATPAATKATAIPAHAPLPPIETLNFDSDFTAFLSANVAEPLKRQALKKLFADPRFNVMDGLDVYIDDYSIPSPIEPELVAQLLHAQFTLNPPATRINAQGYVEDVPPEEVAGGDAVAEIDPPALDPGDAAPGVVSDGAVTPDPIETSTAKTRSNATPDQG